MAEQEPTQADQHSDNDEDQSTLNYKAPAQKTLQELQELDKDDESLQKYKKALLGNTDTGVDPTVPNVQVTRMTLICPAAPAPLVLDLQDLDNIKNKTFVLKEGTEYRIKINFKVNREIVSGLQYHQCGYRKGIKVDKDRCMVGSYGPRPTEYEYLTPLEEAPKGMMARGTYNIKSKFTDDDKFNHLSWEWIIAIKKEWTD